jgi:formimidoylglutamate deiminase
MADDTRPDEPMQRNDYFADQVWLPHGWAADVRMATGADAGAGTLATVGEDAARGEAQYLGRYVLPGMPNLHSHAFQRAMAGLAERRGRSGHEDDSFWTWREVMYGFASRIGPDDLRAIAAQLYVEMLEAGYTQVCEFHYLHHRPDGKPYDDPAAMSLALVEAAREAGIGLTLLPALYMTGGFDGRALSERQRRFGHDVDAYLRLLERLRKMEDSTLSLGVALHSLRAVPEDAMRTVLEAISGFYPLAGEGAPQGRVRVGDSEASVTGAVSAHGPSGGGHPNAPSTRPGLSPQPLSRREKGCLPIHIHIAEQLGEVQDCLALRDARPVEWLLDHAPVDARWCLVHATHMTAAETRRLAMTGAVAGLCPTTEANLGDGLFPLKAYLDAGGVIGVGSDSHISVSPVEELRWLEYGQRLSTRRRNIAVSESSDSVGETLWGDALFGGARASGAAIGAIEEGLRTDLLVLDHDAPSLAARGMVSLVDTLIFAGNAALVKHVMVGGEWVVRDFRHRDGERIAARYRAVVERLVRGG